MSHLMNAPLKILSIPDLEKAVKIFGGILEKSGVFTSYQGRSNPCEYRIKVPNSAWDIGVVKQKDNTYALSWDPYGEGGPHNHQKTFGKNLGGLSQEYTAQVCITQAKKKGLGWSVIRKKLKNGKLQLRMVHA